jgi:hypothetical protein
MLRFNLGLRPAMGLWRMSLAANYAAGVFIGDSQGVSTKKTAYLLALQNYTVSFT